MDIVDAFFSNKQKIFVEKRTFWAPHLLCYFDRPEL